MRKSRTKKRWWVVGSSARRKEVAGWVKELDRREAEGPSNEEFIHMLHDAWGEEDSPAAGSNPAPPPSRRRGEMSNEEFLTQLLG